MTVQEASAAALDDLRHAAALLLRPTRTQNIPLTSMTGGARYLGPMSTDAARDAYARSMDAGLKRLPGLKHRGGALVRA